MSQKHLDAYGNRLAELKEEGRLRRIPPHRAGTGLIDLTLNDYMGLATRADEFREEFADRFGDVSMTASASRLLASDQKVFSMLENYLAGKYGRSALLFNSGYHANVGLVTALNLPGTLWATDQLIHASVIDGIRMARAECKRWEHNEVASLRELLAENSDKYERVIVVCESVYSMDGDIAPLREICELKREFGNVMLYVDEAHALGAFGPEGLGICMAEGLIDSVDILVGTLGKACASAGAFVATSEGLREFLVNCARSLIFSTALAPANAAWSLLMLEKLAKMDDERRHLEKISKIFREGLEEITGRPNPSVTAIVPLMTGSAARAVEISRTLEDAGILALPIRRPTVPPGGERIRFSLNASLTTAQIESVLEVIRKNGSGVCGTTTNTPA